MVTLRTCRSANLVPMTGALIRNKSAVLRRCPVFQHVAPGTVRALAAKGIPRALARRSPVWSNGEHGNPVVVRSGVLKESVTVDAKTVTYGYRGAGSLLGAELLHGAAVADLEAHEESVVLELPLDLVHEWLDRDAGLYRGLAEYEHHRRVDLQRSLERMVSRTSVQRLAASLIDLAGEFGVRDSRGTIIDLRLTHRELASLIGATRETVSFAIGDLRGIGVLESDGKRVVILDKRRLTRLSLGG